jgi:penicillin amidase
MKGASNKLFLYGLLLPLAYYIALWLFKMLTYQSVLGSERQFEHCEITQYDPETGTIYKQEETIKIVQVNYGLKLVEAETFVGAAFGLGFVQAKDRLWYLNFYRYLTTGRIAELVGPSGVPIDKYIRTIGIPRAARRYIEMLDEEELNFLQNYCNGINKAAKSVQVYPAEFYVFMTGFEDYEPVHVAA